MPKHKNFLFSIVRNAADTQVINVDSSTVRLTTATLAARIEDYRKHPGDYIKRTFPAVCWAATFKDFKRHKESAEWTGLAYIDIDHVLANTGRTAKLLYEELYKGMEEEYGIVHSQISPSGDGLHIVFIPTIAADKVDGVKKAQEEFANRTGLKVWDANCHDISRMMFLSSLNDTLYDALDTLYDE